MIRTILNGRTVRCNNLKVNEREDKTTKSITFTIATDRKFQRTTVDENGETKKTKQSDFLLCVAYGKTAETIEKYCNIYDEFGRFISRPLYVEGTLETFTLDKPVEVSDIITVNGVRTRVTLTTTIKQYGCKLVVDNINFLSANPTNIASSSSTAIVEEVTEEENDEEFDETNVPY